MEFRASASSKRVDLHCHSSASNRSGELLLKVLHCPESYSDPEAVHRQARARGMDFVTLTDHDTLAGTERIAHLPQVFSGEELTCCFPEDGCRMHVLVWGLNSGDHAALQARASDIYAVAAYLEERALAHAVAHPLYRQNDKLERWHIERLLLLFKGFECLNGAHSPGHHEAFVPLLDRLDEAEIRRLAEVHRLTPRWPRPHIKARTGGSDDHGLLNLGRTWTALPEEVQTVEQALAALREGRCAPGGEAGSGVKLAHTLYSIAVRYYGRHVLPAEAKPNLATTLLRQLAGDGPRLSDTDLLRLGVKHKLRRVSRWLTGMARQLLPFGRLTSGAGTAGLIRASFLHSAQSRLEAEPGLRAAWERGLPPLGEHAALFALGTAINRDISRDVAEAIEQAIAGGRFTGLFDAISAALAQQFVLLPYYFAFFHQNREKAFLRRLSPRTIADGQDLKIGLFTDTFDDVNGVGRFLRDALTQAQRQGRSLTVHTCAANPRLLPPGRKNFIPLFSAPLPYYPELTLNLPPLLELMEWSDARQFDAIHLSTPGPMGLCGLLIARMLRVPVLGTYHTDFPAYIEKLTGDHRFTNAAGGYLGWFYRSLDRVFVRSRGYRPALLDLGVTAEALATIAPAVDVERFHPDRRDEWCWSQRGITQRHRLLYCGRMSAEKNTAFLANVFRRLCATRSDVALVLAGDGPALVELRQSLRDLPAHFLGYQDDATLPGLYASADLLVFPSRTDTLGQVVMEAQASGLPAVVSDQGGPREIVEDQLTGLVLPGDDVARWCREIGQLLDDAPRRARMAQRAARRAGRFSQAQSFEAFWQDHATLLEAEEEETSAPFFPSPLERRGSE